MFLKNNLELHYMVNCFLCYSGSIMCKKSVEERRWVMTRDLPPCPRSSVCFTVTQKLLFARISFSLINFMIKKCLQTVILQFPWLSFPLLLCYIFGLSQSPPLSFGICRPLETVFIIVILFLVVSKTALFRVFSAAAKGLRYTLLTGLCSTRLLSWSLIHFSPKQQLFQQRIFCCDSSAQPVQMWKVHI